jgi:Uma2 family endonuclease
MSLTAQRLLTAEEFWALPETEGKRELMRGEVVAWMPVGGIHADVAAELLLQLRLWAKQGNHGYVAQEAGYLVQRNPDGVRAADVSFVRRNRIPEGGIPESFWKLAPDLAVEVVSPYETAQDIWDKVNDYLNAATPLVWVVYPRSQHVVVYKPDGTAQTLKASDTLQDTQVLPGFSLKVADLFQFQ